MKKADMGMEAPRGFSILSEHTFADRLSMIISPLCHMLLRFILTMPNRYASIALLNGKREAMQYSKPSAIIRIFMTDDFSGNMNMT